jgi:phosphatidylserine/phosphatidylglycerophosphate/cardiolipin synthase-like enzyme
VVPQHSAKLLRQLISLPKEKLIPSFWEKITVVTRPSEDFQNKDLTAWTEATKQIEAAGIHLIYKTNIHQKFAIIDQKIIWCGSINLLSNGSAEESMMRIESNKIAYELLNRMQKNCPRRM